MSTTRAAIRYAKALLLQTEDASVQKSIFNDMQVIDHTLSENKELINVLKSPIVKVNDKKEILTKVFSKQTEATQNLFGVLTNNHRAQLLADVAKSYIHLYNEKQGVKVVTVTTAVAISPEIEKQVLAKVEALTGSKNISINNVIDPSILGGFILRVGDMQYNASIANQLKNIKREFSKTN